MLFSFAFTLGVVLGGCASSPTVDSTDVPAGDDTESVISVKEDRPEGDTSPVDAGNDHDEVSDGSDTGGGRIAALATIPPTPPLRGPDEMAQTVESILTAMSLRELVGQLVMPAYLYAPKGEPVTEMTAELEALLRDVQPGGFLLFGPNIESPGQLRQLIESMQDIVTIPMIIGIDQEGGIVTRVEPSELMPVTAIPAASQVGRSGDVDLAFELAGVIARELRSLGITLNLAPVADVLTNPENPVIGSRAYGAEPEMVSSMVEYTVRGFQDNGVSAALKHFPGHGDTIEDSHDGMASIPHGMERLEEVELPPFRRGISAGSDAVLIGHISVPAVTGDTTPASLSPIITRDLLRDRLGFSGVIITDALTMGALVRFYTMDEIILGSVKAGADILLRPGDPRRAVQIILDAIERGEISEERIIASARRILNLKFRHGLITSVNQAKEDSSRWVPVHMADDTKEAVFARSLRFTDDDSQLGTPEHRQVVEEILRRSNQ